MKKVLALFTFITTVLTTVYSQNCQVVASGSAPMVCQGSPVTISATATASYPSNQFFNFNQSAVPPGWSTTGGTNYSSSTCGTSPDGTPYFWASTVTSGLPQIVTDDFDICSGGTLQFQMKYAVQAGGSPCEGPDEQDEGVSIQYSLNGGATWVEFIYYRPDGVVLTANPGGNTSIASGTTPFTSWQTFNVPIPAAAISNSTRFRWIQTQSSGGCCDNWGLDNIGILAGPCLTTDLGWSNGMTGVSNFTFIPTADTCFTATLYDNNNNFLCASNLICVQVSPNFTNSFNATICNGDTYYWGAGSALLPYTTSGNYPATFTTINGCDSTVTLNLTVAPVYTGSVNATICSGQSYSFGGNNYLVAGNYPITFQTISGCDSTVTLHLTVNPTPTVNAIPNQSICNGDASIPINFSGNVPGATYNWVNSNASIGLAASGINNIPTFTGINLGSVPVTSTITITPSANNCTGLPITTNITVNPTFVGNPVDITICDGDTYTFGGQSFSIAGSYPTTFNTVYGCDSLVTLNLSVNPTYTGTENGTICNGESYQFGGQGYTVAGNYPVTFQTINGCDSTVTLNLTVNPIPTINAVANQSLCNGEFTASIQFTGNVNGTSYDWVNDNTSIGLGASGNGDIGSFAANNSGTSSVISTITVTPTANNCVGLPMSTSITVHPTFIGSPVDVSICDGDTYTFGGQNFSLAGNYPVTFNTVNGCDSVVTLNLTVNPVFTGSENGVICDDDVYVFGGQNYNVTGNYPVTFQTVNGCDSTVTLNLIVHPTYSGIKDTSFCDGYVYSYGGHTFNVAGSFPVLFQTIEGCDSLITLNITIIPAPAPFAGNDIILCSGEIGNLGGPALPNTSYTWSGGLGLSDYNISDPTVSIVTSTLINNTYVVQTNFVGCERMDTVDVQIIPFPVINFAPTPPQCLDGNQFNFSAGNSFLPGANFVWSFNQGNPSNAYLQNVNGVHFLSAGPHQVTVTVAHGLCSSSDTTEIIVHPEPQASFSALPTSGCIPLLVQFQNNSQPVDVSSQWFFGNGQTSQANAPSATYTTVGTFDVTLIVSTSDGCIDSAVSNSMITTYPLPVAGFYTHPQPIYQDDPYVQVSDNSTDAVSWQYSISSGGSYTSPSFNHHLYDTGYHSITQVVSNQFGCSDQITQDVHVLPATTMFVPNAFTPNNDDVNTFFGAYGNSVREFHILIYDRWGMKLFESRDIHQQWDGKLKGEVIKQDLYVYKITYLDHRGRTIEMHGHVTLIR